MAEHVLATCPTAEACWYPGVGHVPHLEEPARFNRSKPGSALPREEAAGRRPAATGTDDVNFQLRLRRP